jgi:hypothetical protein
MKKLLFILLPLSFSAFAVNNDLCIMGGWDQVNFKIKDINGDGGYKVTKGQKFDGVENISGNCIRIKADRKNSTAVMKWVANMHKQLNNGRSDNGLYGSFSGAHIGAIGGKNLDGYNLPDEANFGFVGTMTLRKNNLRLTCKNVLIAQTGSYPGLYTSHNTWFIMYDENSYSKDKPEINCSDDNGNLVIVRMAPGFNKFETCGGRALKILPGEDAAEDSNDEEFSAQGCGIISANEIKMAIVN